jgi:cytochrome P450
MIGADDPEFAASPDEAMTASASLYAYANDLAKQRRSDPRDDIVTKLINAEIEGDKLSELEFDMFMLLLTVAGNETTRNTTAWGMWGLLQHPEELARLKADPSLLPTAVDEMIRWSSPVKHFMRTATVDYDIRGTTVKAGQDVLLSYWSANRDEDVFADPFRFDVGRTPNKHLAFGFGVHYCLGAMLAVMGVPLLVSLVPLLDHVELAGEPQLIRSTFVSGLKQLPIRYSMA